MKPLVLIAFTACAFAQISMPKDPATATWKADRMDGHGHVRSIRMRVFNNCDPRGAMECPTPVSVMDESYTPEGWLSEIVKTTQGKVVAHDVWRRDGARLLRYETDTTEASPRKEITNYDSNERPIEISAYNPDGTLRERVVRSYDEAGTYHTRYDGRGNLIGTYLFEPPTLVQSTAQGRHTEKRFYDTDASVLLGITEDADKNGTRIQVKFKNGDIQTTLKDSAGHSISTTVSHGDDRGVMKSYFERAGRTIRQVHFGPDGTLRKAEKFAYEDDEQGNWIRQTRTDEWTGGKTRVAVIITRTITYY